VNIARSLCERSKARVILFSPRGEDAHDALPEGVLAIGDVNHQALFSRVDLIVHHGGAGTVAAALRAGVPQLVVPHIVDQFFHGRRVAELGIGPAPVRKRELKADAIESALQRLEHYRPAAERARARVAPEGGAVAAADYIEALARERTRTTALKG
jgi:UDP:flavonoid glycosyltransferase YjiC (YdhE family)